MLGLVSNSSYSKITYYSTFPSKRLYDYCLIVISRDDCRYQETMHIQNIGSKTKSVMAFLTKPIKRVHVCIFTESLKASISWKSFVVKISLSYYPPWILLDSSFSLTSLLKSVLTNVRTLVKETPRRELQGLSGNVQHYLLISLSVQALMIWGQFRTLL